MTELVSGVQADLTTLAANVDARLGYPSNGVNIGGGIHAAPAQSRTIRHGQVIRHPTLSQWRYPWDQRVQDEVPRGLNIPPSATPTVLDGTWGI